MCQPRLYQRNMPMSGSDCESCGCGSSFRTFLTTDEKLERLRSYRDQLEKELAGVKERIGEISRE